MIRGYGDFLLLAEIKEPTRVVVEAISEEGSPDQQPAQEP